MVIYTPLIALSFLRAVWHACRLYGPDKAKTNFPVEEYGSVLDPGALGSASPDTSVHAALPSTVPESPTIIDGQVLSAELQALVRHLPRDHDVMQGMAGPGNVLFVEPRIFHSLLFVPFTYASISGGLWIYEWD